MIYRNVFNTRDDAAVLFDICIPCWELSAKLKQTIDGLTNGPGRVSVPARLIVGVEKQSVVRNRAACLAASRSPFVLWLDDDVVFDRPEWDAALWEEIVRNPRAGIIGVRVKHWQWLDRTPMRPDGLVEDVCGAVMMTRRLSGVGFDDNYVGSQWEDTDYCFAVRQAGYDVVQNNNLSVIHYNEQKNGDHTHNRAYFNRKWGTCR
ncbi:MAG TPA: glycosyltransferase [Opitutaceae bacterium]|nr:glycosyltransferase [Opitutaceae bacterium]